MTQPHPQTQAHKLAILNPDPVDPARNAHPRAKISHDDDPFSPGYKTPGPG
jgi:hypothetical protein